MTEREKFEKFKLECLRLQKKWGLLDWCLEFSLREKDDEQGYAGMRVQDLDVRLAEIYLEKGARPTAIKALAKHEMAHVLISRLEKLGGRRHIAANALYEEAEGLAHKLEELL